jgi:hypothetical protein
VNHPSEKKILKIKELEPVLSGEIGQLFRNRLEIAMRFAVRSDAFEPNA